jgi:hypothetical protein
MTQRTWLPKRLSGAMSDCRAVLRFRRLARPQQQAALRRMKTTRSIFVHIPKTGGKSILASLYGADLHDGFGHAAIDFYKSLFTAAVFDDCFKFAFVRNPWDRLYSGYKFAINGGFGLPADHALQAHIKAVAGSDFSTFVRHWLTPEHVEAFTVFRPQHTFVCDKQGRVMIDRICYFERFEQEYAFVQQRLGCGGDPVHANRSKKTAAWPDVYDAQTKAIVENVYRRDIELFGYTFERQPLSRTVTS